MTKPPKGSAVEAHQLRPRPVQPDGGVGPMLEKPAVLEQVLSSISPRWNSTRDREPLWAATRVSSPRAAMPSTQAPTRSSIRAGLSPAGGVVWNQSASRWPTSPPHSFSAWAQVRSSNAPMSCSRRAGSRSTGTPRPSAQIRAVSQARERSLDTQRVKDTSRSLSAACRACSRPSSVRGWSRCPKKSCFSLPTDWPWRTR